MLCGKGIRAVEKFNEGDLRECHYTLEKLWMQSEGMTKLYIQGIVQIIAAIFHIRVNKRWGAAVSLLKKGMARFQEVDPGQAEIDVSCLLTDVTRLITRLEELGPERLDEINDDELVRFHFKSQIQPDR